MRYRFIRNIKANKWSSELWLPLCFLAAITVFYFYYPAALSNLSSRVAAPFWKGQHFLSEKLRSLSFFLASKQEMAYTIERLSAELEQARALLLDREMLVSENRVLREQFGRGAGESERLIGAILKASPASLYDTAVIDVGSEHGAQVGDRALSGSAVLGVVSKVMGRSSLIEFFSTAGRKTAVTILHGDKAIPVDAEGRGGGEFRAILPREVSILVGDSVIIPGQSPLVFATVEAIEGSETDSFQTIRFKNPVSITALRFLEIQKSLRAVHEF
jgi:cell shape-determining protein MreC